MRWPVEWELEQRPRSRWGCWLALIVPLLIMSIPFLLIAMRDLGEARTVTPVRSALLGTWRSKGGATITFLADGSCVATSMPPLGGDWETTVQLVPSGVGTWSVRAEDDSVGTGGGVDITVGHTQNELYTRGNPAAPILFSFIGDPDDDNEYIFAKGS